MKKFLNFQELKTLIDNNKALLVNVLPSEVFWEEHIPRSVNACVYEISFLDQIKKLGIDKHDPVVFYENGPNTNACLEARRKLLEAGYSRVGIYQGGMVEWKKKGGKTEKKKLSATKIIGGIYKISKKDSMVEWAGRSPVKRHYGIIAIKDGSAKVVAGELRSLELIIDMKKIKNLDLENEKYARTLEGHLRSDDFFDVLRYPEAVFEVNRVHKIGDAKQKINGRLMLKGKSKPFSTQGYIVYRDKKLIVTFHEDIDRTKWGVNYGSSKIFSYLLGHIVNDNISLDVRLEFTP